MSSVRGTRSWSRSAVSSWFRIALPVRDDIPYLLVNERSLNRYFCITEKVVWIDFRVLGLFKAGVELYQLTDMAIGDENTFISEIPFHIIEEFNSVNQLYFTPSCLRFSIC